MAAQDENPFTRAEVLTALKWGMQESEAERLATYISGETASGAVPPEYEDMGPAASMYSEGLLLVVSLASEDSRQKAERILAHQRLETALTPEEKDVWEAKRRELRKQLEEAGKIPRK